MKKLNKKLTLIIGIILILVFLIPYGIGYIPGMTGYHSLETFVTLVIGTILVIYSAWKL